jgi:hypothetical protein
VVEEPEGAATVNYEQPCEKPLAVGGHVTAEKSPSLELELHFRRCVTSTPSVGGAREGAVTSFTLAMKLNANQSSELLEIVRPTKGVIRTVYSKCPIVIPQQTVPFKMDPEKEYEGIVGFAPESEPIENWEKSKNLQAIYPTGEKERLNIELGEKFKGIRTYVKTDGLSCFPAKGEENGKLVTEPGSPYYGWLEYNNGYIFANIEGLEVKTGELTFLPPEA